MIVRSIGVLIFLIISNVAVSQSITTGTLLEEMIDRDRIVKFPSPSYTVRQYSSYDRASVTPGDGKWFANDDRNRFIRTEINSGRREYVLFEADEPGAIVRFWATVASYKKDMILRFYFDDNSIPGIQGELRFLLGKGGLAGYPLSAAVAHNTPLDQQGFNLYLPIPYSKSCKITVECENDLVSPVVDECLYYNINYRSYPMGSDIRTFSITELNSIYQSILDKVNSALYSYDRQLPSDGLDMESVNDVILNPGEKSTVPVKGNKAIRKIVVKLSGDDLSQTLRSTVLSVSFDGTQRVWAPVGDFFGTGYVLSSNKSWYTEVTSDGTMSCYWIMPFSDNAVVTLENLNSTAVAVERFEIASVNREWDPERDMYFGAGWFQESEMETMRVTYPNGRRDGFDLNQVVLTGKGLFVGNGVTLFNPVPSWWGEGDEKIYVDNDVFPSHFGTGSEDYYGYAWCMPNTFFHPFVLQPDGSGAVSPGHVVNLRYRSLDAIPFNNRFRFDMEILHWSFTKMNYAPISFYYLQHGSSNLGANSDMAQKKVVKDRTELLDNVIDSRGYVEFENMPTQKSQGGEISQYIPDFPWSGECQAWWMGGTIGSYIEFTFCSKQLTREYPACVNITKSFDYASYDIYLNGLKCASVDAYSPDLRTQWVQLGNPRIDKGDNTIRIVITGKNPASVGNSFMVGLDRIYFHLPGTIVR